MHTVVVTVATSSQSFPAGTVSGGVRITLEGQPFVLVASAPFVGTFDNVAPGQYSVSAQAVDANGADLGALVTGSVTVAPDAVQVDVPASISVQVS